MLQESRLFKVYILQVCTIEFSEIQFIVNHNSQSDGQNKSAKRSTILQSKITRTVSLSPEEQRRYYGQWYFTLNKSGENTPMRLRSDFRAAVSVKNRLHREPGEQDEEPISPEQYRRWHPSSSTLWWDKSEWNWKCAHKNFFLSDFFTEWLKKHTRSDH